MLNTSKLYLLSWYSPPSLHTNETKWVLMSDSLEGACQWGKNQFCRKSGLQCKINSYNLSRLIKQEVLVVTINKYQRPYCSKSHVHPCTPCTFRIKLNMKFKFVGMVSLIIFTLVCPSWAVSSCADPISYNKCTMISMYVYLSTKHTCLLSLVLCLLSNDIHDQNNEIKISFNTM